MLLHREAVPFVASFCWAVCPCVRRSRNPVQNRSKSTKVNQNQPKSIKINPNPSKSTQICSRTMPARYHEAALPRGRAPIHQNQPKSIKINPNLLPAPCLPATTKRLCREAVRQSPKTNPNPSKSTQIHQNQPKSIKINPNQTQIHQNPSKSTQTQIQIHPNPSKSTQIHQNQPKPNPNPPKSIKINPNPNPTKSTQIWEWRRGALWFSELSFAVHFAPQKCAVLVYIRCQSYCIFHLCRNLVALFQWCRLRFSPACARVVCGRLLYWHVNL